MNLYLILYGLVALAVLLVGISKLYGMGMTVGAVLYGVGAGFLLVTYGLRWFGSDKSILSNAKVPWPPVINTCPDYLTYYKRVKSDGTKEDTCIDTMGVSSNQMLALFPSGGGPAPSDEKYYFPLKTTKSDTEGRNRELCDLAKRYGLTWEGITNGESCILADGSKAGTSTDPAQKTCP